MHCRTGRRKGGVYKFMRHFCAARTTWVGTMTLSCTAARAAARSMLGLLHSNFVLPEPHVWPGMGLMGSVSRARCCPGCRGLGLRFRRGDEWSSPKVHDDAKAAACWPGWVSAIQVIVACICK